jgi:hypothetical protein
LPFQLFHLVNETLKLLGFIYVYELVVQVTQNTPDIWLSTDSTNGAAYDAVALGGLYQTS